MAPEDLEITRLDLAGDADGELAGSGVREPARSSPFSLKLEGWALRATGPPRRVSVFATEELHNGPPLHRLLVATAPNASRPDIASRFPDIPGSAHSGFNTACSLLGVPREFHLRVEALFDGHGEVTIAHIEGRRRPLDTGRRTRFRPIMLRTLGRGGSTWLTQLVGSHPQALAYRPFDFEPRMLDYWTEILRTLSHPYSYAQAIDPDVHVERGWWDGRTRSAGPLWVDNEPGIEQWIETESIEDLATFAQRRIDAFYERVATSQAKPGATRFIERVHEWHDMLLGQELFADPPLVFLVRDMRDLLASRIAFNRTTGLPQFGMDTNEQAEEYVHGAMRSEVDDLYETWRALGGDALLVRYEDLIRKPRETLEALFRHAGLDADERTVSDVLDRARRRLPERQARHKTAVSDAASLERWRRELAPALQQACEQAFAEPLAAFGYEAGTRRPG